MRKGTNGLVYQSGLKIHPRGQLPARIPMGGVYRAVVMATYATDVDENTQSYQVLCDVVLLRSQVPLTKVPVAMRVGVNDAQPWIPKPSTKTLSGEPIRTRTHDARGNYEGEVTDFTDLDGDVVIVQFCEGDDNFPIITGALTHRQTKHKVTDGDGWSDGLLQDDHRGNPQTGESYLRHSGTEARINRTGDVLIDTVGATTEETTETPDPITGGEVRVRVKRGQKLVVAGGSIGGAGGLGGKDLISVTQGIDESVDVKLADSELTINLHPVSGLSVSIGGQVQLTRPLLGPALLDLLGASQPFVRGADQLVALTTLLTALGAYVTGIQPVAEPGVPPVPFTSALLTAITEVTASLAASLSTTIKGE